MHKISKTFEVTTSDQHVLEVTVTTTFNVPYGHDADGNRGTFITEQEVSEVSGSLEALEACRGYDEDMWVVLIEQQHGLEALEPTDWR